MRHVSEAEKYLLDVQSGKVTACKRMKQLADMMLPRFENGYKRWHFDVDRAERPCRFIFFVLDGGAGGAARRQGRYRPSEMEEDGERA